jgi:hypothetical protein
VKNTLAPAGAETLTGWEVIRGALGSTVNANYRVCAPWVVRLVNSTVPL